MLCIDCIIALLPSSHTTDSDSELGGQADRLGSLRHLPGTRLGEIRMYTANSVDILDAGASISVLPLTEIQDVQHEEFYERNVFVRIKYHRIP